MCQSVYQIASGNLRLFVDQVCLPAQEALQQDPPVALRNQESEVRRARLLKIRSSRNLLLQQWPL